MKVTISEPGFYLVRHSAVVELQAGAVVDLGEHGSVSLLVRKEESPYQQYARETEEAEKQAIRETREMAEE